MAGNAEATRSLTTEKPKDGIAWDRILIWFMRTVAAMWLVKAIGSWMSILGVDALGGPAFEAMPPKVRATIIAFAVLDPVAAVGLWLTSTWGGVMWLIAVFSHLLIALFRPYGATVSPLLTSIELLLVIIYVVLSWLSARED